MKPLQFQRSSHCRGQSSLEYVIACATLALALGLSFVDSDGALSTLLSGLRAAYGNFSFALSLPD